MTRTQLERKALETCSSELYWDVTQCLEDMSNRQLKALIACNGDYEREIALNPTYGEVYA